MKLYMVHNALRFVFVLNVKHFNCCVVYIFDVTKLHDERASI